MGTTAVGSELSAFFAPLTDQKPYLHWQHFSPGWRVEEAGAKGLGLVEYCTKCGSWIDTVPNAQLSRQFSPVRRISHVTTRSIVGGAGRI